jgi:hypothetical protein
MKQNNVCVFMCFVCVCVDLSLIPCFFHCYNMWLYFKDS